jgi:hypothetical protein
LDFIKAFHLHWCVSLGVYTTYYVTSAHSTQATCALMNGLVFASYRFFMKIQLENDKDIPTIAQIALAGAGSGIVSSYVPLLLDFVIS